MTPFEIIGVLTGSGAISAATTWATSRATGKAAVISAESEMRQVVAEEFKTLLGHHNLQRDEMQETIKESGRTNLILGRQLMLLRSVILQMLPHFVALEQALRVGGFDVPERPFVIPPEVYDFELYQDRATKP